jgi:hypothetical protein
MPSPARTAIFKSILLFFMFMLLLFQNDGTPMHILVVKHKYAIAVKKAMCPLKDVNRNPTNTAFYVKFLINFSF